MKEKILSLKSEIGLLMLERSAGGGWHLVCRRELGKTILENQVRIAKILQMEMDTNCHDLGRVVYSTTGSPDDLVYLDDAIFESTLSVEESEREYQLLKERARKGLEEVGKGAKSDNKHYRPWEDEAKAVKSEVVESEESPTTFPDRAQLQLAGSGDSLLRWIPCGREASQDPQCLAEYFRRYAQVDARCAGCFGEAC